LVVVVEATQRTGAGPLRRRIDARRDGLADLELTAAVRDVLAPLAVAAVCVRAELPVDIRHNAKIDRTELADWAAHLLAGSGS
jgi:olefin beta-lactone synthetase